MTPNLQQKKYSLNQNKVKYMLKYMIVKGKIKSFIVHFELKIKNIIELEVVKYCVLNNLKSNILTVNNLYTFK